MEDFLQKTLFQKLKNYIEFEENSFQSIQNLSITNLKVKSKFLQVISLMLNIPLTLQKGSIANVKLNTPWSKFFMIDTKQPLHLEINGLKIKSKLQNKIQYSYIRNKKQKIISDFMGKLKKEVESSLKFLNKIKDFFLGTIKIQIKDIEIHIDVQLKHSISVILSIQHLEFLRNNTTNETFCQVDQISLGYKLLHQNKKEFIIHPTKLTFSDVHDKGQSINKLNVDTLSISVNNDNFNDIRRLIALIDWHNSFMNLPFQLWKYKPSIISKVQSRDKFRYIVKILDQKFKEGHFRKILQERREYLSLYRQYLKDTSNTKLKQKLETKEEQMEIWRIQQYRKFCYLIEESQQKKNPNIPEKEKEAVNQLGWIQSWFKSSKEKEYLNELEKKLQNFESQSHLTKFYLHIDEIKISLSINSHSGKEHFLNVISTNNNFNSFSDTSLSDGREKLQNTISIVNFFIEFDKYCGHHQNYKYFLHQWNQKSIQEDQFQDIVNFMNCKITNEAAFVEIQPIKILITDQILEKLAIFKFERIQNNFTSTEKILKQEKIFEQNSKSFTPLTINTSIFVEILQSIHEVPCQSILLAVQNINFQAENNTKKVRVNLFQITSNILCKKEDDLSIKRRSQRNLMEYQKIFIMETSGKMILIEKDSIDKCVAELSEISIKIKKIEHLMKIFQLLAPLKPKKKNIRPIYKLKNMRRKVSIGQEFIDACQNLNEHIVRTTVLSEVTKNEKYLVKEKKTFHLIIEVEKISCHFVQDQLEINTFSISMFQFTENKSFTLDDDKQVTLKIHNLAQTLKNIQQVLEQLEFKFQTNTESESKKILYDLENLSNQLKMSNMCLNIIIFNEKEEKIQVHFEEIQMDINKLGNFYSKMKISIQYRSSLRKNILSPLLEKMDLFYQHEKNYNKDSKVLKLNKLRINIQPSLIHEVSEVIKTINNNPHQKYYIVNKTLVPIKIKQHSTTYFEYGYKQEAIVFGKSCQIIVFNKKFDVSFNENFSKCETFALGNFCKIIKLKKETNKFIFVSNLLLKNHQNVVYNVKVYPDFNQNIISQEKSVNFQVLSSKISGRSKQADQIIERISESELSQSKIRAGFKRSPSFNEVAQRRQQQNRRDYIFQFQIKPGEQVQILLDSQSYSLEISQTSEKDVKVFTRFFINETLSEYNELLITGYSRERDEHLVIKTTFSHPYTFQIPVCILNIMSPVVLINRMPWELSYSYNKEEIDFAKILEKKEIRKRSIRITEKQKVFPTSINRNCQIKYDEIAEMQVRIGDYRRSFRLNEFVKKAKSKQQQKQEEINENSGLRFTGLLCLNSAKSEIQVVISIKYSSCILKIAIYPQYIFLNLTKMPIQLEVNEQQCNYPTICLNEVKDDVYAKEYMHLNQEKLCKLTTLEGLFLEYSSNINIFTGSLEEDVKRKILYKDSNDSIGNYNPLQENENQQGWILYGQKNIKVFIRKMPIFNSKVQMLIMMPNLVIVNKTDWCFFIKGQGQNLKPLLKHSYEFILINSIVLLQACEEKEEISYNQWLKISLQTLGTFYYAKQMTSSNGYESKEYELRKKRLKKAPKIFYRIVMTKYEYGYQILIEESQYPPVTFISRCKSRVKIEEISENIKEEMQENEMAEYAPKMPHYQPKFRLYVVQNYQFQLLGQFDLQHYHFSYEKHVRLMVEEYKDKKIIIIEDSFNPKRSQIKADFLLEMQQNFSLSIDEIDISIMNSFHKELICSCIRDVDFNHEQKTNKKYIRFKIGNVESYSYVGLQPTFLFHRRYRKQVFKLFKKRDEEDCLSIDFVLSQHKHANILQKCAIDIIPHCILVDADPIIFLIKSFYPETYGLVKLIEKYYTQFPIPQQKEPSFLESMLEKNFIIQSFHWKGTRATIKPVNLNRLCLFIPQKSLSYLIQFISWMGDLKPISFDPKQISYQQYTLKKMISLVDLSKIVNQVTQLLLYYPLRQFYNIFGLILKICGADMEANHEQLPTLKKIGVAVFRFVVMMVSSGDQDYQSMKTQYQQEFMKKNLMQDESIIKKIMKFKFAEWIYDENTPTARYNTKILRYERYNTESAIEPYEDSYARVKLALDSSCRNKIFRSIEFCQLINHDWVLGITQEWIVFYQISKDQWIVVQPEQVVSLDISELKKKLGFSYVLTLYLKLTQETTTQHLKKYEFSDCLIEEEKLMKINQYLDSLRLTCYF